MHVCTCVCALILLPRLLFSSYYVLTKVKLGRFLFSRKKRVYLDPSNLPVVLYKLSHACLVHLVCLLSSATPKKDGWKKWKNWKKGETEGGESRWDGSCADSDSDSDSDTHTTDRGGYTPSALLLPGLSLSLSRRRRRDAPVDSDETRRDEIWLADHQWEESEKRHVEWVSVSLGAKSRQCRSILSGDGKKEKREKIDALYAFTRHSLHRLSFGSGSGVQHSCLVM